MARWPTIFPVLLLQVMAVAGPALAQVGPAPSDGPTPVAPPPTRTMTLPEALDYAKAHLPDLLAARARLVAAEESTRIPGALRIPRLAATGQAFEATENNSTASYLNVYGLDLPRIGGTKVDPAPSLSFSSPSTLAALGLREEVFDFGRISALKALFDAEQAAEQGRADRVLLETELSVEEAFFSVEAARSVLVASNAAYERARSDRDYAAAGVQAGLRKPIDLTRAEADQARFEVGRIRALGGLTAAQALFAAAVGVPDRSLDAAGEAAVPETPSLEEAIASALRREPALREAAGRLASQKAQTRMVASEMRPDLSFTATVDDRAGGADPSSGTAPAGNGWQPNVPNWDAGLILTWPFFDASVLARKRVSRRLESAREAEIEAVKQRLGAAVEGAWVDVKVATDALPALERAVAAAKANYDQAEARFKAGVGTSVELADAEAVRVDAEIAQAIGRFDQARARARLARVIAEGLS